MNVIERTEIVEHVGVDVVIKAGHCGLVAGNVGIEGRQKILLLEQEHAFSGDVRVCRAARRRLYGSRGAEIC